MERDKAFAIGTEQQVIEIMFDAGLSMGNITHRANLGK